MPTATTVPGYPAGRMSGTLLRRVGLDGLGGRRTLTLAKRGFGEFVGDGCPQLAAAIAYHALLSIFPLVIVLVWISTWFVDDGSARDEIVSLITEQIALSPDGERELESQLARATQAAGAAGVIGVALLAWSASAMMTSIRHGINVAWSSTERRFFLVGKLLDLGLVALLGALAAASVTISVSLRIAPGPAADVWGPISVLVPFAISFIAFLLAYRLLPAVRTRLRDIWPAALGAAVLMEALKTGFAFYLDSIADNDLVYGSLGAVISFMLFVYLAANLLLLGAEFASELPRVRAGIHDPRPGAGPGPSLRERVAAELRRIGAPKPEDPYRAADDSGHAPPPP